MVLHQGKAESKSSLADTSFGEYIDFPKHLDYNARAFLLVSAKYHLERVLAFVVAVFVKAWLPVGVVSPLPGLCLAELPGGCLATWLSPGVPGYCLVGAWGRW